MIAELTDKSCVNETLDRFINDGTISGGSWLYDLGYSNITDTVGAYYKNFSECEIDFESSSEQYWT